MTTYKRLRNEYPKWIKLQIESLNPGQHFIIPGPLASTINEANFRTMISATNRRYGTNLKVHLDTNTDPPQLWVWYCPDPKPSTHSKTKQRTDASFEILNQKIQSLNQSLQAALTADDMDSAIQINSELESLKDALAHPHLNPYRTVYKHRESITYPLDTILDRLRMTKTEWEHLEPDTRLRLRIKTELSIKFGTHPK